MRAQFVIPIIASMLIIGTFSAAYAVGVWEAKTPIPPVRHSAMSANHDGLFYLMGGNDGISTALSNFDVYDPATDTWTALAPLPQVRYATTAENIGDRIYLIGGWNVPFSFVPQATLYIYDIPSDSWIVEGLPRRAGCSSSGSIDGILYHLNACDGFGFHKKIFDKYNPATHAWTLLPSPPNFHADTSVGEVIDGKFYAVGGHDPANNLVSALDVYDPTTNSWTTKAPIPTPRNFVSGGVIDGKLYVAGGWDGVFPVTSLSTVESYDPATDTWTTEPSLLTPRSFHAGEGIDGKLYVAVGSGSPLIDTLHVYDPTPNPKEQAENVSVDLEEIISANPDSAVADKAQGASDSLETALEELNKDPPDNQAAVGNIEGAIGDIEAAINEGLDPVVANELMDNLAGIAKQLAEDAIDQADAAGGDSVKIEEAEASRDEGNDLRASGDYKDAVNKYKDALAKAESALP